MSLEIFENVSTVRELSAFLNQLPEHMQDMPVEFIIEEVEGVSMSLEREGEETRDLSQIVFECGAASAVHIRDRDDQLETSVQIVLSGKPSEFTTIPK